MEERLADQHVTCGFAEEEVWEVPPRQAHQPGQGSVGAAVGLHRSHRRGELGSRRHEFAVGPIRALGGRDAGFASREVDGVDLRISRCAAPHVGHAQPGFRGHALGDRQRQGAQSTRLQIAHLSGAVTEYVLSRRVDHGNIHDELSPLRLDVAKRGDGDGGSGTVRGGCSGGSRFGFRCRYFGLPRPRFGLPSRKLPTQQSQLHPRAGRQRHEFTRTHRLRIPRHSRCGLPRAYHEAPAQPAHQT